MALVACGSCGSGVSPAAPACPRCGAAMSSPGAPKMPLPAPEATGDGGISSVVPYKNVPALVGYYCAVFSLIPCVGLPLGIVALVFGIVGLKAVRRQPERKGTAHAWVGIILGGLAALVNLVAVVLLIVGKSAR